MSTDSNPVVAVDNSEDIWHNHLFGFEMPVDILSILYAGTVALGGAIGYAAKGEWPKMNCIDQMSNLIFHPSGSIPSLIAGLSFGAILGFGAYQTSVNPRNYWLITGVWRSLFRKKNLLINVFLILVTSLVLSGMMGYRFYNSKKFMPAGLVFTLATLMVIRFGLRFITGRNYI